jgi:hypothetical protein
MIENMGVITKGGVEWRRETAITVLYTARTSRDARGIVKWVRREGSSVTGTTSVGRKWGGRLGKWGVESAVEIEAGEVLDKEPRRHAVEFVARGQDRPL